MTRQLPQTDEGEQFIQFRGRQTSVTVDDFGILFTTEDRSGRRVHRPLPVVDEDTEDPPANAVVRPVAERLTETNPLICWGVCCEHQTEDGVCGDVFATRKAVNSHSGVHTSDPSDSSNHDNTDTGNNT